MSGEKKKYVSPKYEMVKFDTKIMTVWSPGCFGVVGDVYQGGSYSQETCHAEYVNVWAVEPNYWP